MTNASNAESGPLHSLGDAIERLRGKWAAIAAFGVLLVVLGVAAIVFSLFATIATVTLNGVLFLIAGVAEIGIGMHARAGAGSSVGAAAAPLSRRRGDLHLQSGFRLVVLTLLLGAGLIAAGVVRAYLASSPSLRRAARAGLRRRGGHDPARSDHRQPLAAGQRLCARNPARRRSAVSWRSAGRPSGRICTREA